MLKTSVGPNELHLKRELIALRKAPFLRDPETCSSWRSSLSSKSFFANSKPKNGHGMIEKFTGEINHGSLLNLLSRGKNGRQKLHLCSSNSSKPIERAQKLDEEDREESAKESPENFSVSNSLIAEESPENFSLSNSLIVDSKSDTCLEVPVNMYNVAAIDSRTPVRRTIRKFRRKSISKGGLIKHSAASKLLDTTSSSLGILDSIEGSDDSGDYNSENLQHLAQDLSQKIGFISRTASPILHGFGHGCQLSSSRIPRTSKRVGSSQSCTPASSCSYYKYGGQDPSTIGSWDGTATSFDGDGLDQLELPKAQKCGIPSYWSKITRARGGGGFISPSLSDTLKRKGSSILCGGQTLYNKKNLSGCHKQNYLSKSAQGLPLLTNSCDEGHSSLDTSSDELSSKFGELDLEAMSRLNGRRWSSCKSQEGLEMDLPGRTPFEIVDQRTLSQKYQPRSFHEIVGQSIVVQSLGNAISRGKIAPAYLFHGPRGTGKTSSARIFAAALNCLSEENKPCWFCKECTAFSSRHGTNFIEANATNKMCIDQVRHLLKSLSLAKTISQYKVFVIDECHMLSSQNWSTFMKFLEEPLPRVVFIFITTGTGSLPRAVVSRCQKYIFLKVKDADIVCRLRTLSVKENLDIELDALDLIALNSDGSLRDAEIMLDQLSLLGKRITTSLVNELVGVVPDEKLLDLLEIAMSSDTAETVKRSRELINSGVDPIALMSQLAGLIMDIIAGTYRLADLHSGGTTLGGRNLTEAELERLQLALKILSDAEKQLRHSSERSTWFTAALLQLGSGNNTEPNRSSSSSRQSARRKSNGVSDMDSLSMMHKNRRSLDRILDNFSHTSDAIGKGELRSMTPKMLNEIWNLCIHRCHSNTLKQLLSANGRLLSISENGGILIAFIGFEDSVTKSRAERFLSSITNSMEIVLGYNVEVRIALLPKVHSDVLQSEPSLASNQMEKDKQRETRSDNLSSHSNIGKIKGSKILDSCEGNQERAHEKSDISALGEMDYIQTSVPVLDGSCNSNDKGQGILAQRSIKAATDEQRLETAWLQAAEPGYVSQPRPDKNQILPQNGVNHLSSKQSLTTTPKSLKNWDDESVQGIKALRTSATEGHHKEQYERADHYAISPSLLHCYKTGNSEKQKMGYESGPGCNGILCWKTRHGRKVKRGIHLRSPRVSRARRLSLFGQCVKLKSAEDKLSK
ncbi:ATPase, AAA family protein [Musa troglodytarum]|uniref:ATPase, AAA family protein n=1 Tax=Musa troglodytarum TaxID=320322 RepID=A0A9E7GE34_9LILI|nr:ATPase, AAA family protein [Musa troglodytarum]URE09483.1 ATPase, AAA family protein [Musa troglodytarum]URE09484.1 ATPase, AAA family protein [Musa troglodytarum]URE09485.1 ATPase, AAA family protein [Musa troglodytarum]